MTQTRHTLPTLLTLAAHLRLGALGLLAEVLAALGAGRLAAALRRRMVREVAALERFATGIVVLLALKSLPPAPDLPAHGRLPAGAPPGFARSSASDNDMRAMRRKLFPRERDLMARLRRFDAVLDDAMAAASRLAGHIACVPPSTRLLVVAAPVDRIAARTSDVTPALSDTS